ncbi:MAG: DUF6526 family protein [Flavobacterium sp.]|nr:DUF6526 family protein [Flavobacterium sp.]
MKQQSYKNYIRFYTPHHFIFYPVMSILFGICAYQVFITKDKLVWLFIGLLFLAVIWLSFMMRQHYALTLQDRIVRMELRYRYYVLTGADFGAIESKLIDSQIFALRFCSDTELPDMVSRALKENLSGKAIKRAIRDWKGDYHRV